jgi:hypothetical protein
VSRLSVVGRRLALAWTAATALALLGISVGIVMQPKFPLNFGIVRTTGLTGLWATFVPGLLALTGVALIRVRTPLAAALILVFSCYWAIVLAGGLPVVWNATSSFCLNGLGVCITIPWIGRAVLLGLIGAFALTGLWAWRALRGPGALRSLPGEAPRLTSSGSSRSS